MSEPRHAAGLLLDLDGTLADTEPDLTAALNAALVTCGHAAVDASLLRPCISGGGRAMVRAALGDAVPEVEQDRVRHAFLNRYLAHICERTRLYPGMAELLEAADAAGLPWGIVTNKLTLYTAPLVAALGLATRSACVIAGDTLAHAKPHPAPMLEAARLLRRAPERCLYVGDHGRDIEAGRAAGMRTLVALWGYLDPAEASASWGADGYAREAAELAAWLDLPR